MKEHNSTLTVGEWVEQYLKDYVYPVCKPSAAEHYADNLRKHLVPALGEKPLSAVTAPVLQEFFNEEARHGNLRNRGPLSSKSLKNLRTAVSACLSQAVSSGLLGANPVSGTVIRRTPRKQVEVMTEEDLEKLLAFLEQDGNRMNPALRFAAKLGLRRGELCALRFGDYDSRGFLHVRNTVKRLKVLEGEGTNKTQLVLNPVKSDASDRSFSLPPDLVEVVEQQREEFARHYGIPGSEDYIFFDNAGTMIDPDNLSHYFSDVLAGLGLPHVKLHALRHTFASRAVELGVDIETVSGLLGHADVSITSFYYLHPRQQAMNDALWKLSGAAGTAPKGGAFRPGDRAGEEHVFRRRAQFDNAG